MTNNYVSCKDAVLFNENMDYLILEEVKDAPITYIYGRWTTGDDGSLLKEPHNSWGSS